MSSRIISENQNIIDEILQSSLRDHLQRRDILVFKEYASKYITMIFVLLQKILNKIMEDDNGPPLYNLNLTEQIGNKEHYSFTQEDKRILDYFKDLFFIQTMLLWYDRDSHVVVDAPFLEMMHGAEKGNIDGAIYMLSQLDEWVDEADEDNFVEEFKPSWKRLKAELKGHSLPKFNKNKLADEVRNYYSTKVLTIAMEEQHVCLDIAALKNLDTLLTDSNKKVLLHVDLLLLNNSDDGKRRLINKASNIHSISGDELTSLLTNSNPEIDNLIYEEPLYKLQIFFRLFCLKDFLDSKEKNSISSKYKLFSNIYTRYPLLNSDNFLIAFPKETLVRIAELGLTEQEEIRPYFYYTLFNIDNGRSFYPSVNLRRPTSDVRRILALRRNAFLSEEESLQLNDHAFLFVSQLAPMRRAEFIDWARNQPQGLILTLNGLQLMGRDYTTANSLFSEKTFKGWLGQFQGSHRRPPTPVEEGLPPVRRARLR